MKQETGRLEARTGNYSDNFSHTHETNTIWSTWQLCLLTMIMVWLFTSHWYLQSLFTMTYVTQPSISPRTSFCDKAENGFMDAGCSQHCGLVLGKNVIFCCVLSDYWLLKLNFFTVWMWCLSTYKVWENKSALEGFFLIRWKLVS